MALETKKVALAPGKAIMDGGDEDGDRALGGEQTYDSALATMITRLPSYIIPLVNEAFGEKYTAGAAVEIKNSKHVVVRADGRLGRRETDAYVKLSEKIGQLVEKYYPIECETWYDKSVIIRIAEYSSVIAVDNAVVTPGCLRLSYPKSVAIFLRPSNAVPRKMTITHCSPDGRELSYEVPTIQIQDSTLDELFEKKLLLLLPFYRFRYSNEFDEMDGDEGKRRKIGDVLHAIEERLDDLMHAGEITAYQKLITEELLLRVSDRLTMRHKKIREGVDEIMSGYIIRTMADEIKEEGIQEGIQKGLREGIQKGLWEGIQEAADLMNYLWSNGRGEDAKRASTDQGFMKRLLAEFKEHQERTGVIAN
ncbi:MAG: hypothetical protein IJ679_02630 [Lachnospiraceae bacterium]|nr:hypothetical protein [Lachnospiraceae bacterium]